MHPIRIIRGNKQVTKSRNLLRREAPDRSSRRGSTKSGAAAATYGSRKRRRCSITSIVYRGRWGRGRMHTNTKRLTEARPPRPCAEAARRVAQEWPSFKVSVEQPSPQAQVIREVVL